MSTKNYDGHVRISDAEREFMEKFGIGFTRIFRIGLDTLKLWIQAEGCPSCVYLYNTGKNRAPPVAAVLATPKPPAHACPCPACPIRAAFADHAACLETCGQKENEPDGPALSS